MYMYWLWTLDFVCVGAGVPLHKVLCVMLVLCCVLSQVIKEDMQLVQ